MVGSPRRVGWGGTSGKTRRGCLFTILVAAFAAYYGADWGQQYIKYWRLKEEMFTQATMAAGIDDATIQRRVVRKVDELQIPAEAKRNLRIRRRARPREIVITTTYDVPLKRPFMGPLIWTFRPAARQAL